MYIIHVQQITQYHHNLMIKSISNLWNISWRENGLRFSKTSTAHTTTLKYKKKYVYFRNRLMHNCSVSCMSEVIHREENSGRLKDRCVDRMKAHVRLTDLNAARWEGLIGVAGIYNPFTARFRAFVSLPLTWWSLTSVRAFLTSGGRHLSQCLSPRELSWF